MTRMTHPNLPGRHIDVAHPRQVEAHRRAGWVAEGDDPTPDGVEYPPGNASRDEWADFAVKVLDADPDDVDGKSRDELRDQFGPDADA